MKKEYRVSLYKDGNIDHNVYITCENIKKVNFCTVIADGMRIDFILEIFMIEVNE